MKTEYINAVLKQIKDKNAKKLIEKELESHIADKIDYYTEIGYSPEQAEQMAVEEMGSPDDAAVPLGSLHDIKWYQKYEVWISLAVLLFLGFLRIFYPLNFKYTDSTLSIIHFISIDFVSLLVIALIVFLIYLIRKRHNNLMILPICTIICIAVNQSIFEPALYAIVKICISGFDGYVDSIFGYSSTVFSLSEADIAVSSMSIVLAVILFILSLWQGYIGYSEQIFRNVRKSKKLVSIVQKALCCLLATNLVIMIVSTVIAACELDNKRVENYYVRKEMIDFYVNQDTNNMSLEQLLEVFGNDGYKFVQNVPDTNCSYVYNKDNAAFVLSSLYNGYDNSVIYAVTTIGVNSLLNDDFILEESDFDKFKQNMVDYGERKLETSYMDNPYDIIYHTYENPLSPSEYTLEEQQNLQKQTQLAPDKRPLTMDEFFNEGLYTKAYEVSHNGSSQDKISESFDFSFKLKNSEYSQVTLYFSCNMLITMTFTSEEI